MMLINVAAIYEYLLALLIVYGNGSWIFYEKPREFNTILCACTLIYVVFLVAKNKICLPNFLGSLIIFFPITSSAYNINNGIGIASLLFTTVFSVLIAILPRRSIFSILDKAAEILFGLMIVSIILGTFFLFVPISSILPLQYNETNPFGFYNLFIYTDKIFLDFRVQSIFWEPGAWAVNQAFCMCWYAFYKKNNKYTLLFVISFLLTMSTTGFILMLIILVAIYKNALKNFALKKKVKFYTKIFFLLLVSAITILNFIDAKWKDVAVTLLANQTVDKFTKGTLHNKSYEDRTQSSMEAFHIAVGKPLFGEGRTNRLFVTSTIFQVLYQTGFLFCLLFILFFWKIFSPMGGVIAFLFIIILLNGEVMGFYSLYMMVIVLGSKLLLTRKLNVDINNYSFV